MFELLIFLIVLAGVIIGGFINSILVTLQDAAEKADRNLNKRHVVKITRHPKCSNITYY